MEQECSKPKQLDSLYTTKCEWPKLLPVTNLKDSLRQTEEIMGKYKKCYIRHNGLVEVLNNGY